MSRWRRHIRSFYCRAGLLPHRFRFWARIQDGSETLIVERCIGQPWCRAVRSYPFHPLVPEWLITKMERIATMPNPYRALFQASRAGTAATAPAAPPDIPTGFTQPFGVTSSRGYETTEFASAPHRDALSSRSSTATADLTPTSSTSTPTPFDDWRRSPKGS